MNRHTLSLTRCRIAVTAPDLPGQRDAGGRQLTDRRLASWGEPSGQTESGDHILDESRNTSDSSSAPQRGFLDYYEAHGIIPVQQIRTSSSRRRDQRCGLYRTLGVPLASFVGRRVLEFGPGTGENSEIVAEFGPASLDLVDGNDASIRAIRDRMGHQGIDPTICRYFKADFNDDVIAGVPHGSYDVVIAEGCIPGQVDPTSTLRSIARYVAPNGLLIVTTADQISVLAENCRRMLSAPILRSCNGDFEEAVDTACRIFDSHLDTLTHRSRSTRDWVFDMVLHPYPATWSLSLIDALQALPDFSFHGSSPRFVADWRWYKSLGSADDDRPMIVQQWKEMSHLTIDYRTEPVHTRRLRTGEYRSLHSACIEFDRLVHRISSSLDLDLFEAVEHLLQDVLDVLVHVQGMASTNTAIRDFQTIVPDLVKGNFDVDYGGFRGWFGRGQQYLALTRNGAVGLV
jgi:SAM-dependent methyltransferase